METIVLACVAGCLIAIPATYAIRWYAAEDEYDDQHETPDAFGR